MIMIGGTRKAFEIRVMGARSATTTQACRGTRKEARPRRPGLVALEVCLCETMCLHAGMGSRRQSTEKENDEGRGRGLAHQAEASGAFDCGAGVFVGIFNCWCFEMAPALVFDLLPSSSPSPRLHRRGF